MGHGVANMSALRTKNRSREEQHRYRLERSGEDHLPNAIAAMG